MSVNRFFIGLLIVSIRFYQRTISPDHGVVSIFFPYGVCRYQPTCSEYAAQAIRQYGPKGVFLALRRVAACHPWARGGYDPVPTPQVLGARKANTV